MGKRRGGWRDLAVLISHFTATPRPIVGSYGVIEAIRESAAINRIRKLMNGKAHQ
jgi:hypothetical protein